MKKVFCILLISMIVSLPLLSANAAGSPNASLINEYKELLGNHTWNVISSYYNEMEPQYTFDLSSYGITWMLFASSTQVYLLSDMSEGRKIMDRTYPIAFNDDGRYFIVIGSNGCAVYARK